MKMPIIVLATLVSAGCYNPTFKSEIACGAGDTCPPGTTCGTDSKCHESGTPIPDAPISDDAQLADDARLPDAQIPDAPIDAKPVQCSADPDCATPPDLCSKAGTCDLVAHACVFPAVDCTAMNDECNHGVCQAATGTCARMPANQDQSCGQGTVCGGFGNCNATSGACGNGMQFRSCTTHTCQAGTCASGNTTDSRSCSTDGLSCGTAVITCDDTRCGGAANMSCAGTEPCTETDQVCSAQACITTTKAAAPRACTEPNGTTCNPTQTTCGSCFKDSGQGTCGEAGHVMCTDTTFSCQAGACSGAQGPPTQGGSCMLNTDGDFCTVRCTNGTMECTCSHAVCTNCGPCTT
jgi:hypothetical protein